MESVLCLLRLSCFCFCFYFCNEEGEEDDLNGSVIASAACNVANSLCLVEVCLYSCARCSLHANIEKSDSDIVVLATVFI